MTGIISSWFLYYCLYKSIVAKMSKISLNIPNSEKSEKQKPTSDGTVLLLRTTQNLPIPLVIHIWSPNCVGPWGTTRTGPHPLLWTHLPPLPALQPQKLLYVHQTCQACSCSGYLYLIFLLPANSILTELYVWFLCAFRSQSKLHQRDFPEH